MSLAAVALRAVLDAGKVEVGLSLRGVELTHADYQRQAAPRWRVENLRAESEVTFGPFRSRVEYDGGLLFIDGAQVDTMPTPDGQRDSLSPGTEFVYRAVIRAKEG